MSGSRGNAFIEYFVLALIVLLASVAFFRRQLERPSSASRRVVQQAFNQMVNQVLAP